MSCEICLRNIALTKHHLIPVSLHKNKKIKAVFSKEELQAGVDVCRECHNQIHALISEKDLAREYYTFERLTAHEGLARYLNWVRSKKPGSKIKVSKARSRRRKF